MARPTATSIAHFGSEIEAIMGAMVKERVKITAYNAWEAAITVDSEANTRLQAIGAQLQAKAQEMIDLVDRGPVEPPE